MNLQVPEKWEPFIRAKVQSGEYASLDALLDEALGLLEQQDVDENAIDPLGVEDLLLEGLNSGPPTVMTRGEWDKIWAEGERLLAERKARKAHKRDE